MKIISDFLSLKDTSIHQMTLARGIPMERLVTFLRQLVVPLVGGRGSEYLAGSAVQEAWGVVQEADICKEEVAAVVARLSRVKVQAARFRAR